MDSFKPEPSPIYIYSKILAFAAEPDAGVLQINDRVASRPEHEHAKFHR